MHLSRKRYEIEQFQLNFCFRGMVSLLPIIKESIFPPFFAARLNFCINRKYIKKTRYSHFGKIIIAHWDALFLLCKKTFAVSFAKQ